MGVVTDLLTEITTEGGFEVTSASALVVLDRRHKQMVARARWHRMTRTVAATTAADASHSVLVMPTDVVEVFSLLAVASTESAAYRRTSSGDRGMMVAGTLQLSGSGGVFVEDNEDDATDTAPDERLLLYPAVAEADVIVNGAFRPPTITEAETAGGFVRVPSEFHEALVAGVYASLLMRPGEARPDLAAPQEQMFMAGCQELKELASQRYRTRGPSQIRLQGQTV